MNPVAWFVFNLMLWIGMALSAFGCGFALGRIHEIRYFQRWLKSFRKE